MKIKQKLNKVILKMNANDINSIKVYYNHI